MVLMFLTLTSEAAHASDLGFLLHKHPDRAQRFELPVGVAHVFYPEANDQRCTVALLLEVDPVGLVRGRRLSGDGFALAQYVTDRPYAASSMLSVAIGRVFGTAMKGTCKARPDLEGVPLPLTVHVPALPARGGGADIVERLFAPLGWQVDAIAQPLDPEIPRWGESRCVDLTLTGTALLSDALAQLYVLLPVLDGSKHYWVSTDEVDKLIRNAGGWLHDHPEREFITRRYLAHRKTFIEDATARLDALDDVAVDLEDVDDAATVEYESVETAFVPLVVHRKGAVIAALKRVGAARVVDLGCGDGSLTRDLLADPSFTEITAADVSATALQRAERRLNLDRRSDHQRSRITLLQSSATYRDERLAGRDAVVLMEVIEHLDPERLPALERSVFEYASPRAVVVTTPNAEYNVLYEGLRGMRHPDHRFEWTRAEFEGWARGVASAYGYQVVFEQVGDVDEALGSPTQLALFTRDAVAA